MDNKIKELVAIGSSVVANCQPCLTYHIKKAEEYGVEVGDIKEAIDTGKMVRAGAWGKMDKFISGLGEEYGKQEKTSNDCGCR